jgi:hypothetical protein
MKSTHFIRAIYGFAALTICILPAAAQGAADASALLANADINNDGVVTHDEFLATRSGIFKTIDANASGGLDPAEFTTALDERVKRFANRAFATVDANGDGTVSQAEWDSAPTRAFDKLDSNNDNTLSSEEISKAGR